MRRALTALVILALAAPAFGADLAQIKSRGVLRVIAAADDAPETFSFAGGTRPGFERELAEGFAKLHGLRLEPVKVKLYSDRIPALNGGDGDLIVAIFDTVDRRKQVDFTVEVMPTHNVAVTLASRPAVKSLAELATLKVGAIRGAKPAEEAAAAGVAALSLFDTQEEMKQALKRGSIDSTGLTAGVTVGPRGKVAWAVRKQDTALRAALDEYLGNVRRGPSWSRLLVQYFGDQALQVLGRGR
jgi:ABC-type amino acid transport substrate-binding protein